MVKNVACIDTLSHVQLYYQPEYRAYYTLDKTTGEYAFHSQAAEEPDQPPAEPEREGWLCVRLVAMESSVVDGMPDITCVCVALC